MTTTIIGFPRIGEKRELKFATEKYWKHEITQTELLQTAHDIRLKHWKLQQQSKIDLIPVGDFSFFDGFLDTFFALNIVPKRYRQLGLSTLDEYFALGRGFQDEKRSVKALPMKKWFNTNYHYLVPDWDDYTDVKLVGTKLFDEIKEAKEAGVENPKAVVVGPYTLLKLSRFVGSKKAPDFVEAVVSAYAEILEKVSKLGVEWIQIDEPALCFDVNEEDRQLFKRLYTSLLSQKGQLKVLLQTYFGDIRDVYEDTQKLDFDGIGLDLVATSHNVELIQEHGFDDQKVLFAGIINGKNIWRNDYQSSVATLKSLDVKNVILSSSSSLLHVPFTAASETQLPSDVQQHLAFAVEKLGELHDLNLILEGNGKEVLNKNAALFENIKHPENEKVRARVTGLTASDYVRQPERNEREKIQKEEFNLPVLPTTKIGSFPQTRDVRQNRARFRKNEISREEYDQFNKDKIKRIVEFQEDIGLDVLVHGEYERNDMVEYFGEKLDGFVFTKNGWVQSYGTRGVKPPIIWGDVSRNAPITVDASVYAQSLTDKIMKGMLTGPVTIFNWSFPREDIQSKESVTQIALAIQDEVLDLEEHGIKIIQIDEAALREKLPLRKTDWFKEYLDWAIPAFRLVHSSVQPTTQIHTHMCYSEFGDIIQAIDDMDADVISFEASRADLVLIDQLVQAHFETEVGPGVYDIHSPRVPSVEEIQKIIEGFLTKLPIKSLWINPDCGLKTRGEKETFDSLKNLVEATRKVRINLHETSGSI